jgi:hypothetical protein
VADGGQIEKLRSGHDQVTCLRHHEYWIKFSAEKQNNTVINAGCHSANFLYASLLAQSFTDNINSVSG